jgi:hypothetical protein
MGEAVTFDAYDDDWVGVRASGVHIAGGRTDDEAAG